MSEDEIVSGLEQLLASLNAKMAPLVRKKEAIENAIKEIRGDEHQGAPAKPTKPLGSGMLKPSDAAEDLLRGHPNQRFKASEVTKKLLEAGFLTASKHFNSVVASALNRLAKKSSNGIERERVDGIWVYEYKRKGTKPPIE